MNTDLCSLRNSTAFINIWSSPINQYIATATCTGANWDERVLYWWLPSRGGRGRLGMGHKLRGKAGTPSVGFLAWPGLAGCGRGGLWGQLVAAWGLLMDQEGSGKHHPEPVPPPPFLGCGMCSFQSFPMWVTTGQVRIFPIDSILVGFSVLLPCCLVCVVWAFFRRQRFHFHFVGNQRHRLAVKLLLVVPWLRLVPGTAWWPSGAGVPLSPPPWDPLCLPGRHVAAWGDINCC